MKLDYLRSYPQLYPQVARWIYDQFRYGFEGSWQDWLKRVEEGQQDGSITTFIALEAGEPVATASFDLEDLPARPDLSPWLASVYTRPEYRGRGIAGLLVGRVEQEAQARGFDRIYLHTTDQEGFYAKRGWQRLGRIIFWDREIMVMTKHLGQWFHLRR